MDKTCVAAGLDSDHFANGNLTEKEVMQFKALWAIQLEPHNGYNTLLPELETLYDMVIDRTAPLPPDAVIPPKNYNGDLSLKDASIHDLDGAYQEKLNALDPEIKTLFLQKKEAI